MGHLSCRKAVKGLGLGCPHPILNIYRAGLGGLKPSEAMYYVGLYHTLEGQGMAYGLKIRKLIFKLSLHTNHQVSMDHYLV